MKTLNLKNYNRQALKNCNKFLKEYQMSKNILELIESGIEAKGQYKLYTESQRQTAYALSYMYPEMINYSETLGLNCLTLKATIYAIASEYMDDNSVFTYGA